MEHLLTTNEAAERLGCKPKTLCNWRVTRTRDLPFLKIGSKVMYHPADIEAFITRHRKNTTIE